MSAPQPLTVEQFAEQLGVDVDDVIEAAAWTAPDFDPEHIVTDESGTEVWEGDVLSADHQRGVRWFLQIEPAATPAATDPDQIRAAWRRDPVEALHLLADETDRIEDQLAGLQRLVVALREEAGR